MSEKEKEKEKERESKKQKKMWQFKINQDYHVSMTFPKSLIIVEKRENIKKNIR